MHNIVINICEKFHNDRLRNDRSLGNGIFDNNNKKNNVGGHQGPVPGSDNCVCHSVSVSFVSSLNDFSEDGAPPAPGAVGDNVGRVGDERSGVSVELTRLVRRTSPLPMWTHDSRVC